jgi:ketosteroid isomerase-like protein
MEWAKATQEDKRDDILINHHKDVLIYDVLPPMKYNSANAYKASWDDWHPNTESESVFTLKDLQIQAGEKHGFATCFIQCGGILPNGKKFSDLVRATFCLALLRGKWKIVHQHISKPFSGGG